MPELPEVQTIVDDLKKSSIMHQKILGLKIFWVRSIAYPESTLCQSQIAGQHIKDIQRRGKWMVFTLSRDTLLVHLRMTGKFLLTTPDVLPSSHERLRLNFNHGISLSYFDQRKFGKWYLVSHPEEKLAELGLEPLSEAFTLAAFEQLIRQTTKRAKAFLLDQSLIAGLGNIYVDESLWIAQIHPEQRLNHLSPKQIEALHAAIIQALQSGLTNKGTSLGSKRDNYATLSGQRGLNKQALHVFRREGKPCPRCQAVIKKITVVQRGTHICASCQTLIT